MDENSGSDPTRPLLSAIHDGRTTKIIRRNSVNSLRSAFLSTLPDKVRSSIDSESPFDVDLSNATALSQGPSSLYLYIYVSDTDTTLIHIIIIRENESHV